MGEVVSINDARRVRDLNVEEAFAAYVEAREKVEQTRDLNDAIAAAKLWKRFLELFTGPMR